MIWWKTCRALVSGEIVFAWWEQSKEHPEKKNLRTTNSRATTHFKLVHWRASLQLVIYNAFTLESCYIWTLSNTRRTLNTCTSRLPTKTLIANCSHRPHELLKQFFSLCVRQTRCRGGAARWLRLSFEFRPAFRCFSQRERNRKFFACMAFEV